MKTKEERHREILKRKNAARKTHSFTCPDLL